MDKYHQPSLVDLLIATLASNRSTRVFKDILREKQLQKYKEKSMRNTLTRLNVRGYVKNSNLMWSLTDRGRKYFKEKELFGYLPSHFPNQCVASMIISFDIPERDRKIRNWLRNQMKIFGYKMLQQSLWIGPGPLPPSFLKRLEDLNIRKNIKTFNISRGNK